MQTRRTSNLDFLEGIIIGIYGNWLISLIDHIDFETIGSLSIVLPASFIVFIFLFIWKIVTRHPISFGVTIIALAVHFVCWVIPYYTSQEFSIHKFVFGTIGATLFLGLVFAEMARTR